MRIILVLVLAGTIALCFAGAQRGKNKGNMVGKGGRGNTKTNSGKNKAGSGGRGGSKNSDGRGKAGSEAAVKSKCGLNEEYKICGELCEGSCSSAELVCMKESGPPCVCKKGFFRNSKGKCVKDCSTEPCPANMVRKTCAMPASCQEACESSNSSKSCNKKQCVANACECKPGFILQNHQYKSPKCIPKKSCKKPWTRKALPATKKPNQVSRKPKPKNTKKPYQRVTKKSKFAYERPGFARRYRPHAKKPKSLLWKLSQSRRRKSRLRGRPKSNSYFY